MLLTPKYSQYLFCLNRLRERKGNNETRRLCLVSCSFVHVHIYYQRELFHGSHCLGTLRKEKCVKQVLEQRENYARIFKLNVNFFRDLCNPPLPFLQ